jgi:hypothetical protein
MNFDATQVDFSTAEFGPGKASPIHGGHVEDVNNDDIFDIVLHLYWRYAIGEFSIVSIGVLAFAEQGVYSSNDSSVARKCWSV